MSSSKFSLGAAQIEGFVCPACRSIDKDNHSKYHQCTICATVSVPARRSYNYDNDYPADRGHFDPAVGRCKQITLASWIRRAGVSLKGLKVLEIGFGGAATLSWMAQQDAIVHGQEVVKSNRDEAVRLGIPPARVKDTLDDFCGESFDLILYLDVFEHILEPAAHLDQIGKLTHKGSRALVVLPVAESMSRLMLRSLWPHDLPDHWVFYSSAGLAKLWERFGWRRENVFYPWKFISVVTAARHVAIKTRISIPTLGLGNVGFWLNFGERAFVFERP
jgi:hypothetical protein